MQVLQSLYSILNTRKAYFFLLFVVGLLSLFFFYIAIDTISGDHYTYLYYVKGMHEGRYSYWYFLKDYIPDTFRNPGFPIFLYLLSYINDSVLFIKIVQLVLLFFTIFMMLKIIDQYDNSLILKNLFLVFVSIHFVGLTYPAFIYPESLMMFLITIIVYIEIVYKENSWKKMILLALLYGYCFQVRPVILFIPLIRFLYYLYHSKKVSVIKNLTFIIIFFLTLLPYGFWNLKYHHQFKITPIEGGAGAMYLGYWSPKLINYRQEKYWRNVMYKDILFNFSDMKDVPKNILLFNNEMDSIDKICAKYITANDSVNLQVMKNYPNLFVTMNTKYTNEREKILKTLATRHYLQDWRYTIKLKAYTFFRLWYTSLSLEEKDKQTLKLQLPMITAFIGTGTTLLLFIFYFLFCVWKRRDIIYMLALPLLFCLYFDIFHVPFVIQSRYTIPVRMLFLFSLAFMIYKIHFSKNTANEPHQNI
ncbi:MAG: hypothetical protein U0T69_06995 [Chitinophagales bacterium]